MAWTSVYTGLGGGKHSVRISVDDEDVRLALGSNIQIFTEGKMTKFEAREIGRALMQAGGVPSDLLPKDLDAPKVPKDLDAPKVPKDADPMWTVDNEKELKRLQKAVGDLDKVKGAFGPSDWEDYRVKSVRLALLLDKKSRSVHLAGMPFGEFALLRDQLLYGDTGPKPEIPKAIESFLDAMRKRANFFEEDPKHDTSTDLPKRPFAEPPAPEGIKDKLLKIIETASAPSTPTARKVLETIQTEVGKLLKTV